MADRYFESRFYSNHSLLRIKIICGSFAFGYHLIGYTLLSSYNSTRFFLNAVPFYTFTTPVDALAPFAPWFVWPYFSYMPLLIIIYLMLKTPSQIVQYSVNYVAITTLSFISFYWLPVALIHQPLVCDSISCDAVRYLRSIDAGVNLFPSLHATHMLLAIFIALRHITGNLRILIVTLASLILASTIFTKQHYVADVLVAALVTPLVWFTYLKSVRRN